MMSFFRYGLGVGLLVLMLGTVGSIRADVVFSNLGPNDDWDHHHSYVVDGPNAVGSPRPYAPAMPFTPTFTSVLTSIELPLGVGLVPGTNALVVGLLADADGLPGDALEWYVFEDLPFVFSSGEGLSEAFSDLQPILEEGVTYWVAVLPGGDDTAGGWSFSSPLQTGTIAYSEDAGASWTLRSTFGTAVAGFRVNGDPISYHIGPPIPLDRLP